MKYSLHREGTPTIIITLVVLLLLNASIFYFFRVNIALYLSLAFSAVVLFLILNFFRIPKIDFVLNDNQIIAPVDGKVVVIEEVEEPEYFKDKRMQVSIFMSPLNVHVQRNPIQGEVKYVKYHPGQYLVAWHPKSSTLNERFTSVVGNDKLEVLSRQIAGKLARRICNYLTVGDKVEQCSEFGFIKFGSRVDLFLPLNTKINVNLNDVSKGGITVIGTIPA